MEIKFKRQESITVKSTINNKVISDDKWEVFTNSESEDNLFLLVRSKDEKNTLKIEIFKNTKYE
jgi:hypothetical protein